MGCDGGAGDGERRGLSSITEERLGARFLGLGFMASDLSVARD